MILVVGSTGQLGTRVVRKLCEAGAPVRAFARRTSDVDAVRSAGAEVVFGDLREARTVAAACAGVDVVIATASGISPGAGGGDVKAVDDQGLDHLIRASRNAGVRQFIFASIPPSRLDDRVLLTRAKRRTERRLQESGTPYTIFRLGLFADVWPALLGSRLPERGAEAPTLQRPFWFLRSFRKATGDLIEARGRAMVPGRPTDPVNFITIEDVASLMVGAIDHPEAINQILQVGGPEILSWKETIEIFSRVLNRPIRASYTPSAVFRLLQLAMTPISRSAASVMGLNWINASGAWSVPDPEVSRTIAARFGVTLTPFEDFLRQQAQLDPELGIPA
jgi:uncharacterized protein YbjT (DUF2867 family)